MNRIIKLKNADNHVLLDNEVFDYLSEQDYFKKVDFLNNLRKHSSGCAVFQKTSKKEGGGYQTETIYLHKLVAEIFIGDQKDEVNKLVGTKNNNKLDCRKENLVWRSRSWASRQRKTTSKTGFMGVYRENKRFRAVISVNGKSVHIGMYDTPKEAAEAYNRRSWELFGHRGKQNKFNTED
ncbi:MAG: hypothetical protein ACI94Y_002705 [Maribacter sp.]